MASSSSDDSSFNAITNQVAKEVQKLTGQDPYTTPMKIYTSIDLDAQEQATKLCSGEGLTLLDNKYYSVWFHNDEQPDKVKSLQSDLGLNVT